MAHIAGLGFNPPYQRCVVHWAANAAAWHQEHVRLRTIFEGEIRDDLLAKHHGLGFEILSDRMHQEASCSECFPWAGEVDNFRAVEEQNGNGGRTASTPVHWNQLHAALGTITWLIKSEFVARLAAWRADINPEGFIATGRSCGHL